MVIGFVGFGEANSSIALGLSQEGMKDIIWAGIVMAMKEEGISAPPVSILDENGVLTPETHKVLDVIAKHGMILATGHISHEETFALVKSAAEEHSVKRIIITCIYYSSVDWSRAFCS